VENGLTYPEAGATRDDGPMPAGYHRLRRRMRIGRGEAAFHAAADAVLEWRLHKSLHLHPQADHIRAEPGANVWLDVGTRHVVLIRAHCRVVWVLDEPRCKGFAYGTMPGHPERGEEAFVVEWDADDSVWLTVKVFSVAARWYTKIAGPLTPLMQRVYALCCGVLLRRLIREARSTRTAH
jgi:uncharacterized protein (UPF0548 family)